MGDKSDEEALDGLAQLYVMVLAMRDVVTRLVAYEALRHPDGPESLLHEISEASDTRLDEVRKKLGNDSPLNMEEGVRKNIDLLLAQVRLLLP
jgi:hypothetical protein